MKSKLLLALLLTAGSAVMAQEAAVETKSAPEVSQSFGYVSLGGGPFPIPLPIFGLGYRTQAGHHGADLSLQATTVVEATQLKANLLYHHYFKPSLASQFYVGGGIGPSVLLEGCSRAHVLISPELVLGKQYRNEANDVRFFQAQISFPTIQVKDNYHRSSKFDMMKFPLVVISYGWGF